MKTWLQTALGALAALVFATTATAQGFTIAVVPDTQNYSDITLAQPRGEQTFAQQMRYLVDQRQAQNLVFVTFVGDLIQHGDGRFRTPAAEGREARTFDTREEWDIATRSVSILSGSGLPFGMVPGNHDYDNYSWWLEDGGPGPARPLAGSQTWRFYFGPFSRHFARRDWYLGSTPDGMTSAQTFDGDGRPFLHLSLQMDPTSDDLGWAQSVIDRNPGLPIIVSTHEWTAPEGTDRADSTASLFPGTAHLSPDQVWDHFIRRNPMIFLVLSGHAYTRPVEGVSDGQNLRIDANDASYPVYQVLQDYQGNTVGPDGRPGSANGGGGWLRLIRFDVEARKIRFSTYSPLLDRHAGRNGERTFGLDPSESEFTLDFPPQLLEGR